MIISLTEKKDLEISMRKYEKVKILEIIENLTEAHKSIVDFMLSEDNASVASMLTECQDVAIEIGNFIEEHEGEGHISVSSLEAYCETLFSIFESINEGTYDVAKSAKALSINLEKIKASIKENVKIRKKVVFLPYKSSMWDSLESIYLAAAKDPDCEALVIPIPYFDRKDDRTFGTMHYEGNDFPSDIPITDYNTYDLSDRPDMIFIHNPYDLGNFVTSVHPLYYSDKLKKLTDCLVYVPYYATSGGMGEDQAMLPAYNNADYIVIQSEAIRAFFDEHIPDEKFLPFGSPKFDAVINKCANPPKLPLEWGNKIYDSNGNKKKVYFYNTSLSGMLSDTEAFLKKMEYVFNTFKKHPEVCLLWRPHPLFDSTIDRLRPEYRKAFDEIRQKYIDDDYGIYDTTPSIENTIAHSDVYIGDAGTSVTSLFGVVGKPLFILDNKVSSLPSEDDWRSTLYIQGFCQTPDGRFHDKYAIGTNNDLYYSPNNDYHYEFYCKLTDYAASGYYSRAYDYKDKVFIFPAMAQDILILDKDKKLKKIELKSYVGNIGAFQGPVIYKNYAYIMPNRHPSMVRINLDTEQVSYLDGVRDFNLVTDEYNTRFFGARWIKDDVLYILSGDGKKVMTIDTNTFEINYKDTKFSGIYSGAGIRKLNDPEVYLIPARGSMVIRWNMDTDEVKQYDLNIEGLRAIHRGFLKPMDYFVFSNMAFVDDYVIFAPNWGNKFIKLNPETGEVAEWESPFDTSEKDPSEYMRNYGIGYFLADALDENYHGFYYVPTKTFYNIDMTTKELTKRPFEFSREDVFKHAPGYGKESEAIRYCCNENVINTLEDLLTDNISGEKFNKSIAIGEYMDVNSSPNGDCGLKTYEFLSKNTEIIG